MAPIMATEPSYQPIQSQIKLQVDDIKPWLVCDKVHMSDILEWSNIAFKSEHAFGVLKSAAPKNMISYKKPADHNLPYHKNVVYLLTYVRTYVRSYVHSCKYVYTFSTYILLNYQKVEKYSVLYLTSPNYCTHNFHKESLIVEIR